MQAHGLTLALMHTCTQSIKMKVFPTLWLAIFSFLNFFLILSSYNKVSWFIRKNKKKSLKLFKHIYTTVQEATVCRVKEMNIVCTICQSWHNGWLSQDGPYSLSTGIKENSVCLSYFWQGTLQDKILDRQFWTLSDKENYYRLNTGVSTNPVRWDSVIRSWDGEFSWTEHSFFLQNDRGIRAQGYLERNLFPTDTPFRCCRQCSLGKQDPGWSLWVKVRFWCWWDSLPPGILIWENGSEGSQDTLDHI